MTIYTNIINAKVCVFGYLLINHAKSSERKLNEIRYTSRLRPRVRHRLVFISNNDLQRGVVTEKFSCDVVVDLVVILCLGGVTGSNQLFIKINTNIYIHKNECLCVD